MMDATRKGEIALRYLKHKLQRDGIRLTPNIRRETGDIAKAIGVSFEEAMEFAECVVRELVDEAFTKPRPKASDERPKFVHGT